MKTLCQTALLSLIVILNSISANAQQVTDSTNIIAPNGHYVALSLFTGVSGLFLKSSGMLQVSFPYSVKDASGSITNNVFASQPKGVLRNPQFNVTLFKIEIGRTKFFYDASAGILTAGGLSLSAGAGTNFYILPVHKHGEEISDKALVIKASCSVMYAGLNDYQSKDVLGSIDNENKTINAFGKSGGPVFTISGRYGKTTYNVNTMNVAFYQNQLNIVPELSISTNPYRHSWITMLSFGYMLPVSRSGGVFLFQKGGSKDNVVADVSFSNKTLTAFYNDRKVTATPYRFPGFCVTLSLSKGFFHGFNRHKGADKASA